MDIRLGNWLRVSAGKTAAEKPQARELGATGTSVFAGLLYENEYNRDLQGEAGLKIYDKMRRSDGQVKAGLLACKLPLQVARWDIVPPSDSAQDVEIAKVVKDDLFEGMSITWDDFIRQSLLMLDFGHMPFEKVWEMRDGRWTWHKIAPRLPISIVEWHVKPDGGLDYIRQQAYIGDNFKDVDIPVDKLLVFTHEMEGSDFRGISLLRAAYKHWYYKNNLYAIDGIAAERHGVGLATFTYPDQATTEQKDKVKEIGERLHAHERAYVATPESIKFALQGVQGQLHDIKGSIEHHDLQIVRSILAQFMNLGAKSTGSYALSQDQSSFFLMALQSVGKNICGTINRHAIKQMVDYNWDVKQYPKLVVSGLDNPDIIGYAQAISQLVTSTAIVPDADLENELRRMLKLPLRKASDSQPGAPDRPLEVSVDGQPAPEGPAKVAPAAPADKSAQDTAENIVEGEKLNGIQITASLAVLQDLIAKNIPAEVALELLVAVGIDRARAQSMVDACKNFEALNPPPPKAASEAMKAGEFWRAPTTIEKSVAFSDIKKRLTSFEDEMVSTIAPIQARQIESLVDTMAGYIRDGQFDRMTEIDVPFRDKVAKVIEAMLTDLMAYGAEQVKAEAKRQGSTLKAQEPVNVPTSPQAFVKVRSLAVANILANKLRAALSWEALRQLREGGIDKGRLTAAMVELSESDLRNMAGFSVGEAFNLGRQAQADQMGVKNVTSSALMDDNTCDFCRGMDGKSWTPGNELTNEPPYDDCEGRDRCRCVWVYTFSQEV
ncbi:MAG: DUF935 domain-containing protein, partial [Sphaerochaeta sp.]|nr:DUF935 domain-containing protein [Sphaerochaeta sp.]